MHKGRKPTLCKIVGDGIPDVPQENVKVILTGVGQIVENTITYINKYNEDVVIEKYVIMPNHIHLLITIDSGGTSGKPSPTKNNINARTNEIIPKTISSFKRFTNKKSGDDLWQRAYIDHVIRNESDYLRIWEYIENNPLKWGLDKYYIE